MSNARIKQPSSRTCFLCGRQNDVGLKMTWYNNPEAGRVEGTVTIPEHFNGYPGVAHGGIVAAILDETAGRAVMLDGNFDELFVTLKLEMTYRDFTPTGTPLTAIAWVERRGSRNMRVAGQLQLPDGRVTAECKAIVARPPEEISRRWEPERPFWKVYAD